MIHFTRTSSVVTGKMADALAFAGEVTDYLASAHDQKLQLMMPVGGNPHRLSWYSSYENLGAMEKFQAKTMSDAKYLAILSKAAGIFIPGTTHDDIWRSV